MEQGDVHGRINHDSLAISLDAVGHMWNRLDQPAEAKAWFERARQARAQASK
ncbi:MAG: hypothetical protein AAGA48_19530 [Myxococcota bacterium]